MENTPNIMKKALNESITEAIIQSEKEQSEDFFLQKQKDENRKKILSRNRVLDKETVIKLILSMGGGSLQSELLKANINATVSAFVQQRKKISWIDFENIFEGFNKKCIDNLKHKGYRIYAIDGTTINIARNQNSDSYVQYDGNVKGFNQLHANILLDVMNHTFKHCLIQPQPQQDEVGALVYMLNWYDFEEKNINNCRP